MDETSKILKCQFKNVDTRGQARTCMKLQPDTDLKKKKKKVITVKANTEWQAEGV